MREGGFAGPDEPLDPDGLRKAKAARPDAGKHDVVLTSPAEASRQTAQALGLSCSVDRRLRDVDYGRWQGLSFEQVLGRDPAEFAAWIADPARGTPGGESFADTRERIDRWIGDQQLQSQAVLAITHPMIVRAALSVTLGLSDESVMRFDIAPLSVTILSHNREWRLQTMGR